MRARLLLSVAILIAVIAVSSMLSNVYAVSVASDEYVFDFKFGGNFSSADGHFNYPHGVAYDHNNNRIIVADIWNNRIQVFDSNGNFLFKFGNFGSADGQFGNPLGVAYDHNNNRIIVADTYNHRIQVFNSNGNFLFKFGNVGSGDGEFANPIHVAYDHNNNRIIVADTSNHRIQVFGSNGNFLFKFGSNGSGDGQFAYPFGVAYDHNNNRIIVADTSNHRIQVFSFAKYSLTLYEGSNPSDGVINLGDSITAKATTKNNIINVKFRWIDPSNNEVRNTTVPIVSGEASDTYTPNQVGTWKVVAEFSNGTIVVKELQVPFQVVGIIEETLEFNNTTDFINKLSNILTNEGLSSEQINAIISKIDTSQIPSQGIIKLQLKHGSIYGLGVIMPHDPPLNINESIKVIVLYASLGSPININDLHVKAISPTNNEDILLEENWYPNTIDDPFVWISPAIAVNEAGEWHIVTDFTTNDGNTSTVVLTIQTRFGVVPESIIGALSVIGSSLAVLAVYRRKRKVNNN